MPVDKYQAVNINAEMAWDCQTNRGDDYRRLWQG